MISLKLIPNGDGCWPDLDPDKLVHVTEGMQVAVLPSGMESGAPSVSIRLDLPDGTVVIAETSAKLFVGAGRAINSMFPGLSKLQDMERQIYDLNRQIRALPGNEPTPEWYVLKEQHARLLDAYRYAGGKKL